MNKSLAASLDQVEADFTFYYPTAEQNVRITAVREAAKAFAIVLVNNVRDSADRSAAMRKIREAAMTANAGIVLECADNPST